MQKEINPLQFSKNIIETYRRYLFSATPISFDEPELRDELWRQIDEFQFFDGPYIQYQHAYKQSVKFADIFTRTDSLSLDPGLKSCFDPKDLSKDEFRLYKHQEESLIKAKQGENLLIATGTGSGKTECFLLPVLDDAIKNPGPGIRSIIVYPMNALANDQLYRLSSMLEQFTNNEVTFGRYTGETPWDKNDAAKKYPDYKPIPCERFTREEIRENPPHILLTNFAMLEYLLIRPKDVDIFSQNRLKYIVLDEAHTYRGAQGIEVALLMRRLKDAFWGSKFQFFLTSATFVSGQSSDVKNELAQFASNLTGSTFQPDNVIFGETHNPFLKSQNKSVINPKMIVSDDDTMTKWIEALSNENVLKERLFQLGWINKEICQKKDSFNTLLYELLVDNEIMKAIQEVISKEPSTVKEIAEAVFPDFSDSQDSYLRAIQWFLIMGSHARASKNAPPLLGTRMHIFFRGLNGACVCLNNECPAKTNHSHTKWSYFSLSPLKKCPECESNVFPIEVCWHCGLPVLTVYVRNNQWRALFSTEEKRLEKQMLTWWEGVEDDADDEDKTDDVDDIRFAYICGCGYYSEKQQDNCVCGKKLQRLKIIETKDGDLRKCPRCGGESGAFDGVTRSFMTADDAPTAVLAETAIRNLPEVEHDKPAGGRSLLAFSDSRQRAAFFAPYLKRTTCESGYQKPLLDSIVEVVRNNDGVASFEEVANMFVKQSKKHGYIVTWNNTGEENETYEIKPSRKIGHTIRQQLKLNCLISLYRHFCNSPRQKNKMMGLALCSPFIEILTDEREKIITNINSICSDSDDYLSAIQRFLNLFLARKAVRFVGDVQGQHISKIVLNAAFHRTQSSSSRSQQVYRFNPYKASNSRSKNMAVAKSHQLKLLCKWLNLDPEKDQKSLCEILDSIWDALYDENDPDDSILVDAGSGKRKLNGERILIEIPTKWYQCQNCGYLAPPSLNFLNCCPSPHCSGKLVEKNFSAVEDLFSKNHLRNRYKTEPLALEVKEHTAQLQLRRSQKYQTDFINKDVNVLSCSTTFEMGVDVGNLRVAMLRNIPPSPANYIQRAGRVGRRNEGVSYVVIFSRKLPHDQFFFCNPKKIIAGEVNTPFICLDNTVLTQRHINSFMLGKFLKKNAEFQFGDRIKLEDFFLIPDEKKSAASFFSKWVDENKAMLIAGINRIIPKESGLDKETAFQNAKQRLFLDETKSVFHKEIKLTLADYDRQILELKDTIDKTDSNNAKLKSLCYNFIDKIEKFKQRFKEQGLIDFLSKVGWLPGYAFPQDVVELRVLQADYSDKMNLARDREVGISEYAPGSEIIADGKVFKSRGIIGRKTAPKKNIVEPKKYMTCKKCRVIKQFGLTEKPDTQKCDCGKKFSKPRTYIIPEGFSTRIDDNPEDPRFRRIKPPPNSEIFLVEGSKPKDFQMHKEIEGIVYALKKEATLFRANMGFKQKQFRICLQCGAVIEKGSSGKTHKTFWGHKCSAGSMQIKPVDLANEFKTDALQIRFSQLSSPPPEISDRVFWISFVSSFLNGVSRLLNIDLNDLAGTYNRIPDTDSNEAELVIYDRIPGGAGYLPRIIDNLEKCLRNTLDIVEKCSDPACTDLESSCYTCLRSYNNQFDWDNLQRKPVIDWLSTLF